MTIATYQNGNCTVSLEDDGTKARTWDGEARPEFPESIDLKITDWCDAGCPWCHESSTTRGEHASMDSILAAVRGLPPGVEIAIGGGDPLSHPRAAEILCAIRDRGLVPNVTVNGRHVLQHMDFINGARAHGLIRGLGVSWDGSEIWLALVADANTVVHCIAGVDDARSAVKWARGGGKVLVLGYKVFGRGVKHDATAVSEGLMRWRYWLRALLATEGAVISFDNLALEQLRVREVIPAETWSRCYMGDDGRFTMYVDAVRGEFAVSSTSPRLPLNGMSAREAFALLPTTPA